jgi:uncharacterized sulfatase
MGAALAATAFAGAGIAPAGPDLATQRPTPPNIVLILADDLGWADLGCYGNAFNETPNIDRLARDGARFTRFYSEPVCSPSRACLQTGRHCARVGITVHIPGHWRPFAKMVEPPVALELPLEVETFAERLKAAGYATGYFGKWHLGDNGDAARQGWDEAVVFTGHNVPEKILVGKTPGRTAAFLTEKAVDFINRNRARPFLLQVSHFAVHIPLSTTGALLEKYKRKPPAPPYPGLPEYAGLLEELDQSVGGIAAALDRLGLAENTLFVFVSDNGGLCREITGVPATSNAPLRGEKGSLHEGGIRVPCIIRWPARVKPSTLPAPAHLMDLYPTFLAAAGAAPRADFQPDGISLLPLLEETAPWPERTFFWHFPHYHHTTPATAMMRGPWKYIEYFEDGAQELYNLENDLAESRNLAGQHPEMLAEMRRALARFRHDVQAQMPQKNPGHNPARADEKWDRFRVAPYD